MITREQILAEARSWIGTPWQHGQQAKGAGCDCLGFLAGVAYNVGYTDARASVRDPRFRVYAKQPDTKMLDEVCAAYLEPIALAVARPADVIRMTPANSTRHAQHFGMVATVDAAGRPMSIIHCTNEYPGQVVEHGLNDAWRARFRRAYAWRGVA